jgi:FkbM family methyltransferase
MKRLGYRIVRDQSASPPNITPPAYGLEVFFALLKRYGFTPKHIIDVGANRGTWTRRALQFFPDACFTLIEPQDNLKIYIQDLLDHGCKITWHSIGVTNEPGTLPFTISYRDDSSSFASSPADENAPRIPVRVSTLNDIVATAGLPIPEMIKIDAEGLDLKVLAGASELLGKTEVFFVETAICSVGFENTIERVVRAMNEAGYRVVDITDINRSVKFGVLWLCELAFLRNDSLLFQSVTTFE